MKSLGVIALLLAGCCTAAQSSPAPPAATPTAGPTPFARGEVLNYSVNWPSGLSLGEAQLKAGGGEPGWDFEFTLDAGLPGFDIKDRYRSSSDAQFCSTRLEKDVAHGARKTKETVTFDQKAHQAVRQTDKGGKSEVSISDCVKDGLTFLYFLRRELAGGRLPGAQEVVFGASYQVTATYGDSRTLEIGGVRQPADRVVVSFRGPASSHTVEIFFGRDPGRTPLVIRAPFPLGTFSLDLVR